MERHGDSQVAGSSSSSYQPGAPVLSLISRGWWFRGGSGRNPESEEWQCGQEVCHLGWSLPEVSHTECGGMCGAGEEVRCVLRRVIARRAGVGLGNADPAPVGVERGTVARAELGEGGAVLAWEGGFLVGDVGWLEVEDTVGGTGFDSRGNVLRVQYLPGLLSILDGSVGREAQDLIAELALERFLHIPWTWVCTDRGI